MFDFAFFFYGFLAILSQLIIFRELSVVFYGNELFLGAALSSWLFWVGAGSTLSRALQRRNILVNSFDFLFALLSLLLPLEILVIRMVKSLFYFGAFIGPLPMVAITFFSLSIYCLLLGIIFPFACRLFAQKLKSEAALKRVYALECAGSVFGGLAFTYLFVGRLRLLTLAIILGFLSAFLAILFQRLRKDKKRVVVAVPILALLMLLVSVSRLERFSRALEWKGYNLLKEEESRYSHLAVAQMEELYLFFENGLISAHFPDPFYYEELVHWPLLLSLSPEDILIVGQATTGTLREVLKYKVKSIDYLELDEKVIKLIKRYLDTKDLSALEERRVLFHPLDARFWIKFVPRQYDVVILNLSAPSCAAVNRYYTREFYQELKSRLKNHGILAFSLPSAAEYLKTDVQIFNASIYKTLKSVFDFVDFIPGENLIFLASPQKIDLTKDLLVGRLQERKIVNQYVVAGYFQYKLAQERKNYVKERLEGAKGIKLNTDFRPIAYFYFSRLWLEKFSTPLYFLFVLLGGGILFWSLYKLYKYHLNLLQYRYYVFIFLLGFIGMLVEMILVLSFQALYGSVWWQMGVLFAAFMFGLWAGALLTRVPEENVSFFSKVRLNILLGVFLIFTLLLFAILPLFKNLCGVCLLMLFPFLLALIGFILGRGFPLSGYMALGEGPLEKVSSMLYAADLWGGALSALLTGLLIIPLLGLRGALMVGLIMQVAALVVINKD
ncbi:MAG: hypothetical protein NC936_03850 [Candidatus Omnitrophica bacterium]|nr:hypothetical protein [Candidatus Omnitrophota bacterium]